VTQRSKTELDTLFANNSVGAITPAMLRDFVDSARPSTACLHFSTSIATTIVTPTAFVKAANLSTADALVRFTASDNRLTYAGDATVSVQMHAALSSICAANNQVLAFAFAVNGVVFEESICRTKIATGADVQAVALFGHAALTPGDYVEIWATNDTSTGAITIQHGIVMLEGYLT